MKPLRSLFALALFALAVPLFGDYTMTPDRGPVAGGTEVTFKGNFGWPGYGVLFGSVWAPAVTKVDENTLVVTTPAHLPGPVHITIFEYDVFLSTDLTFTYEGAAEEAFEPLLLPVFTAPIPGAYGSEFRTDFRARLVQESRVELHGLRLPCTGTCIQQPDEPWVLTAESPEAGPESVMATGTPGAFIYVPTDQLNRVRMNLRAYDTSRSEENFGTEIPIVRRRDFTSGWEPITLIGVPSDPRFRNTLRIYGYGDTATLLSIEMVAETEVRVDQLVELPPQPDAFHPSYIELTNFPVGQGMVRVTIHAPAPPIGTPIPPPARWAFVSATNNETQHITLITPQP